MNEVFEAIFPGMMFFWVLFVGQTPMQEVINEKEIRTLERILATPATVSQFVLSKLLRAFILCAAIQGILIAISAWGFGIHWGNPAFLSLVIVANAMGMTGMLAFVYSLARTREQANTLSTISLLIFSIIGGSMFPFEQLPRFLQAVGQFSPNHWGIIALQSVTRGKPLIDVAGPLAMLIGLGIGGSVGAYLLFQRQFRNFK